MKIDLNGRVAIVTGAGGGLGRAHARLLAARGARVVVNDIGGARNGEGRSPSAAEAVVEEIEAAGGEAMCSGASVTEPVDLERMVAEVAAHWGRVDILVNNAGILRDRTFANLDLEDFRAVVDVHLMGAVNCTKAVWGLMKDQRYGRVIFTTSSSGLYGNFGQSNYGAAKLALVGLMNTLKLEGARYDIRVNCLAPTAATRMTEDIMNEDELRLLAPENVAPAVVALAAEDAPSGIILCAGAGSYECAHITLTEGLVLGGGALAPEQILARLSEISDRTRGEQVPESGAAQAQHEIARTNAAAIPT